MAKDTAMELIAAEERAMTEWQPIETAPQMRPVLLFAIVDTETGNWKMETGRYLTGGECWEWGGYWLRPYDIQPTHWMALPEPPR